MATLTATGLTLTEVVKRHGADGNMMTIAEVLEKTTSINEDAPWVEANDKWSNLVLRRASQPSGTFRKFNQTTAAEKSDTVQVRDTVAMIDTWSEHDVKIIDSFSNPTQARFDEDKSFVKGLAETVTSNILYGNTITTPEQFTGLAPRMDDLATTTNVLNEGGTGSDLTSIFVVTWGRDTVFMTYPKGGMAGLQMEDLGKQVKTDSNGNMLVYRTHFTWDLGMSVKDPRALGRVANIESAGTTNIFDEDSLITLLNRMTVGPMTRIYCNETIMTQAQIRLKDKTNVNWSVEQGLGGVPFMAFSGHPVRKIDSRLLLNTEAALT